MNRRKQPNAARPALPAAIMTKQGLRPVLEPQNIVEAPPPAEKDVAATQQISTADLAELLKRVVPAEDEPRDPPKPKK